MRVDCDLEIPEGWEPVRIGLPKEGEFILVSTELSPIPVSHDYRHDPRLILRKIEKWRPATVEDLQTTAREKARFYSKDGFVRHGTLDEITCAFGQTPLYRCSVPGRGHFYYTNCEILETC